MKQKIQLSDHFTIRRLLLFALPSIGMQIVDSTYQVADGYFISNYIGASAFGAENLIYPPLLIVASIGLLFGSGASALLSKELGKGEKERACQLMTFIISVMVLIGIVLSAALYFLMPSVAVWVGASEELIPNCLKYGRVISIFIPFQMLSMAFHSLLITAERPGLGLAVTIANAAINILLDAIFVVGLHWGMEGAALATGLAWVFSAIIPFVFFLRQKENLHFARMKVDLKALLQSMYNGASEMVDSVAYAVVAVIFNLQLIRFLGEAGVEAYAVSEYVSGFFNAVFYGISMTIVPVVGYHLGESNKKELHNLWNKGMVLMGTLGVIVTGICIVFANPLVRLFVGYDPSLTDLSVHAMKLVSLYFLFNGITIYAGSYFTGVNQGTASLLIALAKGIVGPLVLIWILPKLLGTDGLWLTTPFSELLAMIVAGLCITWWWKTGEDRHLGEAVSEDEK